MKKVLLVRSQNRLRSPTAEHIFSKRPDIEVDSAGTNNDAENPVTAELVEWADIIFVMEKAHRKKLQRRFCPQLKKARVICLDIPDDFEFMDPMLIRILEARVSRYLPWAHMWISLAEDCPGKMNQVANSLQHFPLSRCEAMGEGARRAGEGPFVSIKYCRKLRSLQERALIRPSATFPHVCRAGEGKMVGSESRSPPRSIALSKTKEKKVCESESGLDKKPHTRWPTGRMRVSLPRPARNSKRAHFCNDALSHPVGHLLPQAAASGTGRNEDVFRR